MPSMRKAKHLALALSVLPLQVLAQDLPTDMPIRPADEERLAAYHAAAGDALLQTLSEGEKADLDAMVGALSGKALQADQAVPVLAGEWWCRMIKAGGLLPVTAYSPFRCRMTTYGGFEKLTGSQRTKGQIYRDGDRLVYLGTGFIAGDMPPDYAELPEQADIQADPQRLPEVGVVEMVSRTKGRILFPSPQLESRFNILLLTR
jgi:hypothetical protein